jgi:hypothetical protein
MAMLIIIAYSEAKSPDTMPFQEFNQ